MKATIKMPDAIRQQCLAAKANEAKACAVVQEARDKANREIASFQNTVSELEARIESLKHAAITDEKAASELNQAERRLALLKPHIERLKSARDSAPGANGDEVDAAFLAVRLHWEKAVPEAARQAIEPFGLPGQFLPLVLANIQPVLAMRWINQEAWNLSRKRKLEIIDSALAGNLDLSQPAPAESAPAMAAGDAAPKQDGQTEAAPVAATV